MQIMLDCQDCGCKLFTRDDECIGCIIDDLRAAHKKLSEAIGVSERHGESLEDFTDRGVQYLNQQRNNEHAKYDKLRAALAIIDEDTSRHGEVWFALLLRRYGIDPSELKDIK